MTTDTTETTDAAEADEAVEEEFIDEDTDEEELTEDDSSENGASAPPLRGKVVAATVTMRSASGYGRGRSSTPSTTEKIAVFAPIATARVTTVSKLKARSFRRVRIAIRMSSRMDSITMTIPARG